MSKIFLDTNVILEFFLNREEGKTAEQLFAKLGEQRHVPYMTVGSFYTMHDNQSLLQGIEDVHYKDIEDSCQYQAAKKAGCELLITFNDTDFPVAEDSAPRVMTPDAFLSNLGVLRE